MTTPLTYWPALTVTALALAVTPNPASAKSRSSGKTLSRAREMIEKMQEKLTVASEHASVRMQLIDRSGAERERRLEWVHEHDVSASRFMARVLAPVEIRGTAFLSVRASEGSSGQWLFMPALQRTRRLASKDQNDRFLGSDFSYADLTTPAIDDYSYRTVREAEDVVVIAAAPRDRERPALRYKIHRKTMLPIEIAILDKRGRVARVQALRGFRKVSGGTWRPSSIEMTDRTTGHRTVLTFEGYRSDIDIPESTFSVRNLSRLGN